VNGTAVINGIIPGDDVSAVVAAEFDDKNAGTGKTVTFGYSLGGAEAGNYSLSAQPASVTANITVKPVTITGLSASNKQYDGTTTATVTGTAAISGKIAADTVTVSAGTAAFADKYVGAGKAVIFSGYSLGGADAVNYSLSAQPSVTADIKPLNIGIEMVPIPAGTFVMGSPVSEAGSYIDERPQHSVTLTSGFYMGKYPVTQEQYQAVMGSNPSYFTAAVAGESGTPGKLPVEQVSYYDTLVFCNTLSEKEGLRPAYSIGGSTDPADWGGIPTSSNTAWDAVEIVTGSNGYRLPTEAQWEYACRAGTTTAFYNGDYYIYDSRGDFEYDDAELSKVAWYIYYSYANWTTHQVGLKTPNEWGLYDMHGNVWELCWDWYDRDYYSSSPAVDPMGASSGTDRVWRGGTWDNNDICLDLFGLRSANRDHRPPYDRDRHDDYNQWRFYTTLGLGFRLVRP
jgi:formylglycine-generating enzyme required for sulfatase activity